MIKAIKVTNPNNETLTMSLTDPYKSGLIVDSVSGLGADQATINTTDLATMDGTLFNSAKVSERNIVITLRPMQNSDSVETNRQKCYKYFPIKGKIRLTFETSNRELYIDGYVEKNVPDIFSQNESLSISIICPDPNFYLSSGYTSTVFAGVDPVFEFPFENNSIADPEIEFGSIIARQNNIVNYIGDVEIGFEIQIHSIGTASGLIIYDLVTKKSFAISDSILIQMTGSGIIAGDTITITTQRGHKTVTLLRSGEKTNIINAIGRSPTWFSLHPGENQFGYTCETGAENLQFQILNLNAYQGV